MPHELRQDCQAIGCRLEGVVKQEDAAITRQGNDLLKGFLPVEAGRIIPAQHGPHDNRVTAFFHLPCLCRGDAPVGGAVQGHFQRQGEAFGICKVGFQRGLPTVQVIPSVAANGMAMAQDIFNQSGVFTGVLSEDKKSSPGLELLKDFQDLLRNPRSWPIVKGQKDLLLPGGNLPAKGFPGQEFQAMGRGIKITQGLWVEGCSAL